MQGGLDDLRKDFLAFRDEAVWCRRLYNINENMFFSNEERTANAIKAVGSFLGDLNNILCDYFFVVVGRLTDKEKTMGRTNLSANYLTAELERLGLITEEICALSRSLDEYGKVVRNRRNRTVAHRDLETVRARGKGLGHDASTLRKFLVDLNKFCDAIGRVLDVGPLDFSVQAGPGDEVDLLRLLARAGAEK